METSMLTSALEQTWTFFAVGLVVWRMVQTSKKVARLMGWKKDGWFSVFLRILPVFYAAMFGLIPLPTLNVIDAMQPPALVITRCCWFALAGTTCGQIYEIVVYCVDWVRKRAGAKPVPVSIRPSASDVEDLDEEVTSPSKKAWKDDTTS
jgi:hypothetical protein